MNPLTEEQQEKFNKHQTYVIKYTKSIHRLNLKIELEDKLQEAILVLINCIQKWDKTRGVEFRTYLTKSIINKMGNLYKHRKYRRGVGFSIDRFDKDNWNNPNLNLDEQEEYEYMMKKIETFSNFEQSLLYNIYGLCGKKQTSLKRFAQSCKKENPSSPSYYTCLNVRSKLLNKLKRQHINNNTIG